MGEVAAGDAERRPWTGAAAAALLGVFLVESVASMRLLSATSDETTHLPSGYTYLETGTFRLNPQHPPLVKLLAALPLLFLHPRLDLQDAAWASEPPNEWKFGQSFLYGNDADRLLFWGRLPLVLLTLLLGLHVWLWARELFGEAAGLAALVLFAFCPTLIAHGHLVTMDVPLATFSTMSFYWLRAWLLRGGPLRLVAAAACQGLALAAKFSAVVLLPVELALIVAAAIVPSTTASADASARFSSPQQIAGMGARARAAVTGSAVLIGGAFVVVWALYFFPGDPLFYWRGMQLVNSDHDPTYPVYLLGNFKAGGWWYYFPVAFLVKTPIPTLLFLGLGIVLFLVGRRTPRALDEAFLVSPALVWLVATCALADDIGVRYLLPMYPLAWIFASRAAPHLWNRTAGKVVLAALGLWLAAGTLRIYPDHLAYFNEIAGGPSRGPEWLDDSNLDWGQDLKRLKTWMDEKGVEEVRLLYAWNGSPEYYGIRYEPVTMRDWVEKPRPGVYAVSIMWLVRGRLYARLEGTQCDWLDRYVPSDRVGYSFYIYRFEEGAPEVGGSGEAPRPSRE